MAIKILLVSDIHGNFPALEAVATLVNPSSYTYIFNCGDSTVYAPFANETLHWLQQHRVISLLGNTDVKVKKLIRGKSFFKPRKAEKRIMYTHTAETLKKNNAKYLMSLRKKQLVDVNGISCGLYHGSPEHFTEFLFSDTPIARFEELAEKTECRIIITGHSHTPYHKFVHGVHFINPGSVGRMFDGNPAASFAILSISNKKEIEIEHFRCTYDIGRVTEKIKSEQLPSPYIRMYRSGLKLN